MRGIRFTNKRKLEGTGAYGSSTSKRTVKIMVPQETDVNSEEDFTMNKEQLLKEIAKGKRDEEKIKHLMKETLSYRRREYKNKYQKRLLKSVCDEYPMLKEVKYVSIYSRSFPFFP